MLTKKGIPVSPGVAIAPAMVLDGEDQPIPRRAIAPEQISAEIDRLNDAITASVEEIQQLKDKTAESVGQELAAIFGFHLGMLADESHIGEIRSTIQPQRVTRAHAVQVPP